MNILIVSLEFPPIHGGGSTYVKNLVSDLAKYTGNKISVLTSGDGDSFEILDGVSIYRRASAMQAIQGNLLSAQFLNDFLAVIHQVKPKLIHAHHSIPVLALKTITDIYPVPSIYTQHRTPELPGNGIKADGKGLIGELTYKTAGNGIWIAPSHFFAERLMRSGVASKDIRTILPTIDVDFYRPIEMEADWVTKVIPYDQTKKLIVLPVVDRPRKDITFVLEAIPKINNYAILISGLNRGSHAFETYIQQYPHISFVEHARLSDDDMVALYNTADAVVLSSTHEGFGLSGLESLSCGTPTLLRNSPGLNEIASLVSEVHVFETPDELRRQLETVTSNPRTQKERIQLHEAIVESFQPKARIQLHQNVYNEVLQQQYSAGSVCLCRQGDELFVRVIVNKDNQYGLPKGHVRPLESWEQAAKRETKEETGVIVKDDGQFINQLHYSFEKKGQAVNKFSRFFLYKNFEDEELALEVHTAENIAKSSWVPINKELFTYFEHEGECMILKKALELYGN